MSDSGVATQRLDVPIECGLYASCMQNRPGYRSGIRPNHWLPGRDYTVIGQIEFNDCDLLGPGQSCKAICKMIVPVSDAVLFVPGYTWHICEANKIMGYAKVIVNDFT